MNRVTVLLNPADAEDAASLDEFDLSALLDGLDMYGPEPVGFAVEIDPRYRPDLPDEWNARRLDRQGTSEGFSGT